MCLGGLPVILKHKPVSPFPREGDEGQGGVTPWVCLVSGPVGNETQGPPPFPSSSGVWVSPAQMNKQNPNKSASCRGRWGRAGEGSSPPCQASAFLFVLGDLLVPPLPLFTLFLLLSSHTSAFLSSSAHVLIKNKPKYKHFDSIKACSRPFSLFLKVSFLLNYNSIEFWAIS